MSSGRGKGEQDGAWQKGLWGVAAAAFTGAAYVAASNSSYTYRGPDSSSPPEFLRRQIMGHGSDLDEQSPKSYSVRQLEDMRDEYRKESITSVSLTGKYERSKWLLEVQKCLDDMIKKSIEVQEFAKEGKFGETKLLSDQLLDLERVLGRLLKEDENKLAAIEDPEPSPRKPGWRSWQLFGARQDGDAGETRKPKGRRPRKRRAAPAKKHVPPRAKRASKVARKSREHQKKEKETDVLVEPSSSSEEENYLDVSDGDDDDVSVLSYTGGTQETEASTVLLEDSLEGKVSKHERQQERKTRVKKSVVESVEPVWKDGTAPTSGCLISDNAGRMFYVTQDNEGLKDVARKLMENKMLHLKGSLETVLEDMIKANSPRYTEESMRAEAELRPDIPLVIPPYQWPMKHS